MTAQLTTSCRKAILLLTFAGIAQCSSWHNYSHFHDTVEQFLVTNDIANNSKQRPIIPGEVIHSSLRNDARKTHKYSPKVFSQPSKKRPGRISYKIPPFEDEKSKRQGFALPIACPRTCQCRNGTEGYIAAVDCSGRGLAHIPQIPSTAREVYLQKNNIKSIKCGVFSLLNQLNSLDISHNPLSYYSNCSLIGLLSLEVLSLENCSMSTLDSGVLDPLQTLKKLNLSHNSFSLLEQGQFERLDQLQSLELSNNKLSRIKNGTFHGLTSLTYLSLDSNQLRYIPTTFEPDAFVGLQSLETLTLQGNQPDFHANFKYPDQALSQLTQLQRLSLDGHPRSFGPGFAKLTSLSFLNFDDHGSYCYMESPPADYFATINTTKPMDMNMHGCYMKEISMEFFKHVPSINNLDLSWNTELKFEGFEKASFGLSNSGLTNLDITRIVGTKSHGARITNTTFENLRKTKLQKLTADHNDIIYISPVAIGQLPVSLEYLSFAENNILEGDFLFDLLHLRNLKIIVGSQQVHFHKDNGLYSRLNTTSLSLQSDTKAMFGAGDSLKESNVTALAEIPYLRKQPETSIEYCDDLASSIASQQSMPKSSLIPIPRSLEELYLSDVKLSYNIPYIRAVGNSVLRILDYSKNNIKCFGGPISGFPALEILDLSRNFCLRMSTFMFSNMPSLKSLILFDNVLGQSLADDVDGITFSKLTNLENLNLHNNAIKDLAGAAFTSNPVLRNLNLSRNELNYFSPSLVHNTQLEVFDLSSNTLYGLGEITCRQLVHIKKQSANLTVFISNNKFLCSCDNIPFFELLIQQPGIFKDFDSFWCQLTNGSHLTYSRLEIFLPELGMQCVAQQVFVVVLITFSIVILILGVVSMFYYKRWQWKYLYYMGKSRLHIGATHFTYRPMTHVYVTYDQENDLCRRLMSTEILPRLRQTGLSLVFGEIDFPAGPMAASIAGAVTYTNKTLVVFSRDIFQDYFREFEVNLAIMHELQMRHPVIVPVLLLNHEVLVDDLRQGNLHVNEMEQWAALGELDNMDNDLDRSSQEGGTLVDDLFCHFPPEISVYLYGQSHRWLIYDGGSEEFWQNLAYALLEEN